VLEPLVDLWFGATLPPLSATLVETMVWIAHLRSRRQRQVLQRRSSRRLRAQLLNVEVKLCIERKNRIATPRAALYHVDMTTTRRERQR
jgi:hypothetical protein